MSSHKLVTIIGIWADERLLNLSDADAEKLFDDTCADRDFVAAALYKGGLVSPFSGQEFKLIKARTRQ